MMIKNNCIDCGVFISKVRSFYLLILIVIVEWNTDNERDILRILGRYFTLREL